MYTLIMDVVKEKFAVKNSKRKVSKKKWLSGLKRQIVNLLRFLIAGSNPAFFNLYIFEV